MNHVFSLCCLGSPGALLFNHNRLLALQNGTGTTQSSLGKQIKIQLCYWKAVKNKITDKNISNMQTAVAFSTLLSSVINYAHHAQVLSVVVLADDVPQAVEGGAGVLVDGDLLVRVGRFVLACEAIKDKNVSKHCKYSEIQSSSALMSECYMITAMCECQDKSISTI